MFRFLRNQGVICKVVRFAFSVASVGCCYVFENPVLSCLRVVRVREPVVMEEEMACFMVKGEPKLVVGEIAEAKL